MIRYVKGDATLPQGEGDKVLIHINNDRDGWGAGFTGAINKRWPDAVGRQYYAKSAPEYLYRHAYHVGKGRLGEVQFCPMETPDGTNMWIANMIAQTGYKSAVNPVPLLYDALALCLGKVRRFMRDMEQAGFPALSVHCPKIGAGLAGGNWPKIEGILSDVFSDNDITVYEL